MTLTEDNPPLAQALVSSPALDILTKQKKLDGSTSILACGVLHNVFSAMDWNDNSPGVGGATDEMLVRRLARTLQDYKPGEEPPANAEWTCPDEIAALALEILASIASGVQDTMGGGKKGHAAREENGAQDGDDDKMEEDDAEDGAEIEDDGDESDGSMDPEEMANDMEMVTGTYDDDSGTSDLPTLETLLKKAVPQVLRLASPSSKSGSPPEIQTHAVSVLNNLSWSLACVDFAAGQNEGLLKAWLPHGKAIWEKAVTEILDSDTNDLGLATEVTSLAWAVSKALGPEHLPLKEGQHQRFISLYHATRNMPGNEEQGAAEEDPFQGLGVKCIGVLGQLALDPAPLPLNRDIGVFLVTVVSSLPQAAPAEAVEALNQLFDVYGDEDAACDKVFWEDGFLKHLQDALPKCRAMLKGIHKGEERTKELRERAEEAVMNLDRFVQYKRKNKPT